MDPDTTRPLHLTTVVEDSAEGAELIAEHGLALVIEWGDRMVLFDTGQTPEALAANAKTLGVDLAAVDVIMLSHGHYDHTGGLAAALDFAPEAAVYGHELTFAPRFGGSSSADKAIGMPRPARVAAAGADVHVLSGPEEIAPGLLLSGPVPGPPSPAETGFFVETAAARLADAFQDELFLLAATPEGWVLVTGCCHRGLPNTLIHARNLTAGEPLRAIVGGLHLHDADEATLEGAADAIRSADVDEILAGHCTGEAALATLAETTGANVRRLAGGQRASWPT